MNLRKTRSTSLGYILAFFGQKDQIHLRTKTELDIVQVVEIRPGKLSLLACWTKPCCALRKPMLHNLFGIIWICLNYPTRVLIRKDQVGSAGLCNFNIDSGCMMRHTDFVEMTAPLLLGVKKCCTLCVETYHVVYKTLILRLSSTVLSLILKLGGSFHLD